MTGALLCTPSGWRCGVRMANSLAAKSAHWSAAVCACHLHMKAEWQRLLLLLKLSLLSAIIVPDSSRAWNRL